MLVCLIPFQIEPLRLNEETTRERNQPHISTTADDAQKLNFFSSSVLFCRSVCVVLKFRRKKNKRHKNKSRANEKQTHWKSISPSTIVFFSEKYKFSAFDEISTKWDESFDRVTANKITRVVWNPQANVSLSAAY